MCRSPSRPLLFILVGSFEDIIFPSSWQSSIINYLNYQLQLQLHLASAYITKVSNEALEIWNESSEDCQHRKKLPVMRRKCASLFVTGTSLVLKKISCWRICALMTYTLRETRVDLLYSIKYKLQTFNLLLRIECCQLDISSKLYFSSIPLFEEMRDCIFRDTLQLCSRL